MNEQDFRKIIIKLRAKGKQQDNALSKEEINNHFAPAVISDEQLEMVYVYLKEEGITVFDTESVKEEYRNSTVSSTDSSADENISEYLKIYLEEISEMDIPSPEERKVELEKILKDRTLAEEIIPVVFLKDVVDVARLYEGQGALTEDLIGEGNIALILAAKMIDCCETVEEIEEFVVKMVMDAMEALALEAGSGEGFSNDVLGRVNDLNDRAKEISEMLERKVTVSEIANELNVSEQEILDILVLSGHKISYIEDEEGVEV